MAIRISATKLLNYGRCPYCYFLRYEAKIEVPQAIYLVFGQAIHQLIASFYRLTPEQQAKRLKRGLTILFPTSKQSAVKLWISLWEDVLKEKNAKRFHNPCEIRFRGKTKTEIEKEKEKYKELGASMIAKYWEDNRNAPPPVAPVERRFTVCAPGRYDVLLVGAIDQIREIPYRSGKWYIVDLKTGWQDYGEEDPRLQFPVHHDYQFTIYSWAFRRIFGKKEAGIIRYPLGWKGKNPITEEKIDKRVLVTPRNEHHYADLAVLIKSFLLSQNKQLFPKITGNHCWYCDYLEICSHPELITSQPIPVSQFDWGKVDIEIIREQLEEVAPLKKFSQPKLL